MRRRTLALAVSAAALVTVPPAAEADGPAPYWQQRGCDHGHGYDPAARGLAAALRHHQPLRPRHVRRAAHFVRCTTVRAITARLRSQRKAWRRWRMSYEHIWPIRRRELGSWMLARLRNLRGCETRGLRYPANYRIDTHHDGAYQYAVSTWHRAQAYYAAVTGRRVVGWTGQANWASPAHQDVVTAVFWPSHYGEWACRA